MGRGEGEIYSMRKVKTNEVELDIGRKYKFTRRCEGSEKRAKGTAEVELVAEYQHYFLYLLKKTAKDVTQKESGTTLACLFS